MPHQQEWLLFHISSGNNCHIPHSNKCNKTKQNGMEHEAILNQVGKVSCPLEAHNDSIYQNTHTHTCTAFSPCILCHPIYSIYVQDVSWQADNLEKQICFTQ